ncbi:MAG: hypothetical protein AB4060_00735 [Crocosphaera sp.]
MSNLEVRQKVQSYIEQLSPEKLLVAADFLAYLVEREDTEATSEDEHQFWANSSQISLNAVWDNVEDDIYKDIS